MAEVGTVLSNEPKSWVESKVDGVMLPATVGITTTFDPTVDRFREKQETQSYHLYEDAEAEKSELMAAMKSFQTSVEGKNKAACDSTRIYTWDEVEQAVKQASLQYEDKKGPLACVTKFFDKVGVHGKTFNAWLSLLPDGEYSSIVCGAFKLVINAAIHAKAVRDLIFETLASIPATLAAAKLYLGLWQSKRLHKAFSHLYAAILRVFGHIITWLSKGRVRSAAKVFCKQENYEAQLPILLKSVEQHAGEVRDEADRCSQWVIGSINQKMEIQTKSVDGMKITVESIKDDTEHMSSSIVDIKRGQETLQDGQDKIIDVLNAFYTVFQNRLNDFKVNARATEARSVTATEGQSLTKRSLRPKTLRSKILCYDPDTVPRDIKTSISEGHVFSLHDQDRAEYLMNSSEFKDWLTAPASRFMLVNGNAEHDRISPASFACGLLIKSLAKSKCLVKLSFFCGLHTDTRNKDTGAPQMLASLIGQLLEQYNEIDLSFLSPSQLTELKEYNVGLLSKLLKALLKQLPKGYIVLCMIDGISFYEERWLKQDARHAIWTLIDLLDDRNLAVVMKLMVTSAARSTWVSKGVQSDQIFNIPEDMDYSNQGFNLQALGRGAQRQIKHLETDVQGGPEWPTDSSDEEGSDF